MGQEPPEKRDPKETTAPRTKREEDPWYKQLARGTPLAVFVAAGLLIAYEALPALELIFVAMLIALVPRAAVQGLEKLGAGPWLSAIVLLVALGAFGAFVGLVVVPDLVQEARTLSSEAPSYIDSLTNLVSGFPFIPDPSQLADQLKSSSSQLTSSLPSLATSIATLAGDGSGGPLSGPVHEHQPRPPGLGGLAAGAPREARGS